MHDRRRRPTLELLGILGAAFLSFLLAATLDVFEHWSAWSRRYEEWNVDEILTAAVTVVVGLGIYAWRRYREAVAESRELSATQRELAVAHVSYRSLFDHHPFSVFSLDQAGSYVAANAATVELTGYTADELSRMSFPEVVLAEDLPRAQCAFVAALGGAAQQLELRIRHKDGHVIEIEMVGLPMVVGGHDGDGEVAGVYGIAQDITERNRLHRALADALEAAHQASTAKSSFLTTVSHEIRTPLTSMLGASELLLDTDPDPVQERLMLTLDRGGRRLLQLVNEILDFSRLEAGDPCVDAVPFAPSNVVLDAASAARKKADAKGLHFDWDVEEGVPHVLVGDPSRLGQVLGYLLDNAVKFTDRGGVRLTVGPDGRGADHVVFTVQDTGVGIAAAQHRHVFEPFTQADNSITRRFEGTGLGLAIAHQLVTAMGGEIELESVPGRGSRFQVRLPVHGAHRRALPRPDRLRSASTVPSAAS